jgi:hypothetical protein
VSGRAIGETPASGQGRTAARVVVWLATIILFLAGGLSILKLIEFGLDLNLDFEEVIRRIVEDYDALLALVLTPIVNAVLALLREWFDIDLHVHPHWKHVFVLLGIYFFRDSRMFRKLGYYDVAAVSLVWGALVAFATSVIVGLIPLERGDMWSNFLIGAMPVAGFFVYILGPTFASALWRREDSARYLGGHAEPFWSYIWRRAKRNFLVLSVGVVFLGLCLVVPPIGDMLPAIRDVRSPGLVLLAVLILVLAAYWLWRGLGQAHQQARKTGVPLRTALSNSGNVNLSMAMLAPFAASILLVALNELLKLAG